MSISGSMANTVLGCAVEQRSMRTLSTSKCIFSRIIAYYFGEVLEKLTSASRVVRASVVDLSLYRSG